MSEKILVWDDVGKVSRAMVRKRRMVLVVLLQKDFGEWTPCQPLSLSGNVGRYNGFVTHVNSRHFNTIMVLQRYGQENK
jgi:hypothetical protein